MVTIEESALVGAVIVRRGARRVRHLLSGLTFYDTNSLVLLDIACNLASAGLDTGEDYVIHVANALRFDKRSTRPLFEALEAFEIMADETDETLEAFALRLVKTQPAEAVAESWRDE